MMRTNDGNQTKSEFLFLKILDKWNQYLVFVDYIGFSICRYHTYVIVARL